MDDPKIKKAFEVIKSKFSGKGAGSGKSGASSKASEAEIAIAEEEKTKGNDEYKKKNYDQAIYHYDQAIKMNPNETNYYNNKALVYLEMKQAQKVIECCNKALSVYKATGEHDKNKLVKALVRKAAAYALENNYDEAIKLYRESLNENDDPKIRDEITKLTELKNSA